MDLLIDDCRTIEGLGCIARNYKAGMIILHTGRIEKLYLDFDLGEKKTGLDVLIDAIAFDILPKAIILITQNPVGLKQMQDFLKDNNYFRESPIVFVRKD